MNILSISYLFPNEHNPNFGIFVLNRLKAANKYCHITVINPIPWFPFLNYFKRYKDFNKISKIEKKDGLTIYHPRFFIIPGSFRFLHSITYSIAVLSVLKNCGRFDLIDIHWLYPDIVIAFFLKKKFKTKLLATIRGKESLLLKIKNDTYVDEISIRSYLLKKNIKHVDYAICLSSELSELYNKYSSRKDRFTIIPNGVNIKKFHYYDKLASRKKLNIPDNDLILLSVGALIYGKGHDRLIKLLPTLLQEYNNLKLYIIGSDGPAGDYRKELYALVKDLKLENSVIFVGSVPNESLYFWYNAADRFVLASRSEGSPNVLSEALSCGCPSISTNVGAVKEILKYDFMGIISSGDLDSLTKNIRNSLNYNYKRMKIADYFKQYDWDWCGKKVHTVYKQLINDKLK